MTEATTRPHEVADPGSSGSGPSLADLIRMNDLFHETALLHMAVEARLFDRLTEPVPVAAVSSSMGWIERKCRIVLDALAAVGLLAKVDGGYCNAESTNRYLVTSSDSYIGAIIDHQRLQWQLWRRMGDVLAADAPIDAQQELRLAKDSAANAAFNRAMVQLSRDNVADVLALPDLARAQRVLDLCGGHGTYLAALARKHPGLTGEVWDLGTARELAQQTFADYGVEDRLVFKTQNVLEPGAFKEVSAGACMLNDCLHYFDEAEVRTVIGHVSGVVEPGGLLVVMTMTLDDDRVTPPSAAGFSLHMMLNTSHGGLHPTPWIESVMHEAGFDVERRPLGSLGRYTMLVGRRRGA